MKGQTAVVPIAKEIKVKPRSVSSFWEEVNQIIKNIEKHAYQFFEARGREFGHDLEDWFKAEKELFKPVAVDISEDDSMVSIRAELPGYKPDELEINLEPGRLTIKGEQTTETEKKEDKTVCSESHSRRVFRTLLLPVNVVPDNAEATLKNGVLVIKAPKAEAGEAKTNEAAA